MTLPPDHPQRFELNDEVHARRPEALAAPVRLSFLALHSAGDLRERHWRHLRALAERFRAPPPAAEANHYSADLGPFRVKWERHTEFVRYKFMLAGAGEDPFAEPAVAAVPGDWLAGLPGCTMMAAHAALLRDDGRAIDHERLAERLFAGHPLVGATIAGGSAVAFTDFRIHADGFSRLLVRDRDLAPRQAGRMVQRLLEIDTYRIMALLALPVARELAPVLDARERELAAIATALAEAEAPDEPDLLHRLTRLEAEVGRRTAESHYRFGAADAYYALVERRIEELRESRIHGLQTFGEFTERRLAPAMHTCRAVARRLQSLSERTARTTQLLSTRVDIARERQNQDLLAAMDRRGQLQLRLQQTVEGLSVAAVTYYVVGLLGYGAKALKAAGLALDPEFAAGLAVVPVAVLAALGVHRIRRIVTRGAAP